MTDSSEISNAELGRSLTRMETKLDQVYGDHEARLRRVERFAWIAVGLSMAGMVSGVVSAVQAAGLAA